MAAATGRDEAPRRDTGVEREQLVQLLEQLTHVPEGFHLHPKLVRMMETAAKWPPARNRSIGPTAESLALASLVTRGLSRPDHRPRFGARHVQPAACRAARRGERPYVHAAAAHRPRSGAGGNLNSPLSEAGVLGFEYGYSLDCPEGLVRGRPSSATSSTRRR